MGLKRNKLKVIKTGLCKCFLVYRHIFKVDISIDKTKLRVIFCSHHLDSSFIVLSLLKCDFLWKKCNKKVKEKIRDTLLTLLRPSFPSQCHPLLSIGLSTSLLTPASHS